MNWRGKNEMPTDQDQIRDVHQIVAFIKTALESEDVERAFLARKLEAVIKWFEDMEKEKSSDKIMNGLIIALEGIRDIKNQKPKRRILQMEKEIMSNILYLEGGSPSGKY